MTRRVRSACASAVDPHVRTATTGQYTTDMSNQTPDDYPRRLAEEFGDDDPETSRWPFWAAAIMVVGLVVVVTLLGVFNSPDNRRGTETTQIQHAVNDAYTARNSLNYQQYRDSYCAAMLHSPEFPTAEQFAERNRVERDEQGLLVIPTMTVDVNGDTGRVSVTWHREGNAEQSQVTDLTVVREGDEWKVCTL